MVNIKEKLKDEGNKFKQYNQLERYSWALFAEDEWLMTNDFALTGGIRMDKDENYVSHWTHVYMVCGMLMNSGQLKVG